jgi:hypothetical protein
MNPACDLLRTAKSLMRGVAALLVFAALASTADAQLVIQPGEVMTYFFDSNDHLDQEKGIIDKTTNGHNGTSLSLDSESAFVPGHKAGNLAIVAWGDDQGGIAGGNIYWAGSGIYTHTDTHALGIDTGPFTLMVWVVRGAWKGDNMLFGTTDNEALHIGFREGGAYMGFWNNDAGGPGVPLGDGKWHHMAYRYDPNLNGGQQDIYIDGMNVASRSGAGPFGRTQTLLIGRFGAGGSFAGLIDYPRIFNVALTDTNISDAANDNF